MSHELRTPLTSIRGAIGLMNSHEIATDTRLCTELLSIAHNNTERLLMLIDDLLSLQKMESGHMDFNYEELNLSELLQQVIHDNGSLAEHYDVRFVLEQDAQHARVRGDSQRLTQVIVNLLSNAAKFSHAGQQVEIGLSCDEAYCQFYVQDHGVGIPRAFHARLFDRFTQWDASNTRQAGGTGLGLNIVKSIVDRHKGEISFQSREDEGTRFEVKLPVSSTLFQPNRSKPLKLFNN